MWVSQINMWILTVINVIVCKLSWYMCRLGGKVNTLEESTLFIFSFEAYHNLEIEGLRHATRTQERFWLLCRKFSKFFSNMINVKICWCFNSRFKIKKSAIFYHKRPRSIPIQIAWNIFLLCIFFINLLAFGPDCVE
jgi:hypothetical protein